MEHEHASNYKVYRLCIENQNISDHTNKQPGAIPCLTTFMHRLDVDVEARNRIFAFHLGSTNVVLRRVSVFSLGIVEEYSLDMKGGTLAKIF